MPHCHSLTHAGSLRQAGLILMLVAAPSAGLRAEQAMPVPADRPDLTASDDSDMRLFAPIPHWEAPPPPEPVLATPSFMAPSLNKQDAARQRAERNGLARPEIDAVPIRRGLGPAASPLPSAAERAVGMKLGAERLSVSTAIVSGQGGWQRNDTRFDWNVTRGSGSDDDLRWSAAAGGNLQASGSAGQNAEAVLGYRLQPLDIVTLTTEIALAGNYTFAVENGLATSLTPRLKVLADLTQPLSTPWRTVLDLNLGRQVPLTGNSFQTNASALLRLELPTP